jgi:hypothetical protein
MGFCGLFLSLVGAALAAKLLIGINNWTFAVKSTSVVDFCFVPKGTPTRGDYCEINICCWLVRSL